MYRMTVATCYDTYFRPKFAKNALIWLQNTNSEVISISRCQHDKLYRITFADNTETITSHNITCFVRELSGVIRNY